MTACVLAGGRGTRVAHLTGGHPKCLVEVGGKSFLKWQVEALYADGVTHIVMCLGKGWREVIYHAASVAWPLGMRVDFSIELEPFGTGGAVKRALPLLPDEGFLVLNGDTYYHALYPSTPCLLVQPGRGNTWVDGGRVTRYKKGSTRGNHIECGGYYRPEDFDVKEVVFDMGIVVKAAIKRGVKAHPILGEFVEVGSPEGLKKAREYFDHLR